MTIPYIVGDERGPVLEVIVSRTNFISSHTEKPVRVVGLSTALANARDLADWLGIKQVSSYRVDEWLDRSFDFKYKVKKSVNGQMFAVQLSGFNFAIFAVRDFSAKLEQYWLLYMCTISYLLI